MLLPAEGVVHMGSIRSEEPCSIPEACHRQQGRPGPAESQEQVCHMEYRNMASIVTKPLIRHVRAKKGAEYGMLT